MADFSEFVKPQGFELRVNAVSMTVVGGCSCGSPRPVLLTFSPNSFDAFFQCPNCQTQYRIDRFMFDRTRAENGCSIGIGKVTPALIKPSIRDVIDVGKA